MSNLPQQEKYAPDLPTAESQRHRDPEGTFDKPTHDEAIRSRTVAPKNDSPYAAHYGPDALIWSLYLKETEAEDRELVQLWQTGLDSLLVFAGLFAGILTAFLIESRRGLRQDPTASLLQDILHTLQNDSNVSTSPSFHPPTSALPVNYLWFISLTLTLVSALGGVLAKGWLAKYAPASPGVSASDACERHLRAIRAYQWHFAGLIAGIPLLIQLSLFLFFAGLVIFILNDDIGIGYTILALIILIAGIYLLGTVLPWFSPACPFQTTMSDFIPRVTAQALYKNDRTSSYSGQKTSSGQSWSLWNGFWQFIEEVHYKPEQKELEASILAWIIGNSTVEKTIEEAVKVVAGMPSIHMEEFQKAMSNSGAFPVFCERFLHCFKSTPGFPLVAENVDLTEAYLYALLSIVRVDPNMSLTLWQPGGPLYRWDELQPCLHSLAFCVRTEILLAAGCDDYKEGWEQTKQNLVSMAQTGLAPDVQKKLMNVVIQSVGSGKQCLQRTGTLLLTSLVKIGNMDIIAAWPQEIGHYGVITNLLALLNDEEQDIHNAALECLTKLSTYNGFHQPFDAAAQHVIKLFKSSHSDSAMIVGKLIEHTAFHNAIKCCVPDTIKLLKDNHWRIQSCSISIITELAKHAQFYDAIKGIFPDIIMLLTDSNAYVQLAGISVIQGLIEHVPFHDMIKNIVPDIIMLLKDNNKNIRSGGVEIIGKLAEYTQFHDELKDILPDIMMMMKNDKGNKVNVWVAGTNVIVKLARYTQFHDAIEVIFAEVILILMDDNLESWFNGATIVGTLARHALFHDVIKNTFSNIITLLKDNNDKIRLVGARIIQELAEHTPFHDIIKSIFPDIVMLLKDKNKNIQLSGVKVIRTLAQNTLSHNLFMDIISDIIQWLKGNNTDVSFLGATVLEQLAGYTQFQDEIKSILPDIIKSLMNNIVHFGGRDVLGKLVKHSLFHNEIKSYIPDIIKMLKSGHRRIQLCGISVIRNLAEHGQFLDLIKDAVPQIMKLLKSNMGFHWYAVTTIKTLAKYSDILHSLLTAVPHLLPSISGNQILKQVVNIIVESMAQLADPDTITWFADAFSVVLKNPSIGKVTTGDLSYLPIDQNDISTSNSLLSSIVKLTSQELEVRYAGIECISSWVHYMQNFSIGIVYFSKQIASQLKSESMATQHGAIVALEKWTKYTHFHSAIKITIPHIIELLKSKDKNILSGSANVIEELAKHTPFHDEIKNNVPYIVMLLKDKDESVWSAVIGQLAKHTVFHDAIRGIFPDIVMLLKDNNENVQLGGICAIGKLAEHTPFHDAIRGIFPDLIVSLKNNNGKVWSGGASIIGKLVEHVEFHDAIRDIVPAIITAMKANTGSVWSGANVIEKLAEHTPFHDSIISVLPDIITSLKNDHWKDGASVIKKMAEHNPFHDSISNVFPDMITLLKNNNWEIQLAGASVIELSTVSSFHNAIMGSFSDIIMLLKDKDKDVNKAGASIIGILAEYTLFHDPIRSLFLNDIMSLDNNNNQKIQLGGARVIEKLAKHTIFHDAIRGIFSNIVISMKDDDWRVQSYAASVIEQLADHTEFHDVIRGNIPNIIELLKDDDDDVQLAGTSAIKKLIVHNLLNDPLVSLLTSLLKTETSHVVLDLLSHLPTHALSVVVQSLTPSALITFLHHSDTRVSVSSAQLFCVLALWTKSQYSTSLSSVDEFSHLTLKVILYAFACFEHSDDSLKARGTSILTVLVDHSDIFRDIISEVGDIRGFLQLCMTNITPAKVEELLNCMAQFGIMRTM